MSFPFIQGGRPRAPPVSLSDTRLKMRGVSVADDVNRRECIRDLGSVAGGELYGSSAEVFLQAMQFGGAGDRNDPFLLSQQPGKRDLGGRDAFRLG